jgi:hypothetical protein
LKSEGCQGAARLHKCGAVKGPKCAAARHRALVAAADGCELVSQGRRRSRPSYIWRRGNDLHDTTIALRDRKRASNLMQVTRPCLAGGAWRRGPAVSGMISLNLLVAAQCPAASKDVKHVDRLLDSMEDNKWRFWLGRSFLRDIQPRGQQPQPSRTGP